MINNSIVGNKVKCICGIHIIDEGDILTITRIQISWDGKIFFNCKEKNMGISYSSEYFEPC